MRFDETTSGPAWRVLDCPEVQVLGPIEVLKAPRSAPRVLLVKNQPARYMVPFDDALLTYELRPESHQVVRVPVISLEITAKAR